MAPAQMLFDPEQQQQRIKMEAPTKSVAERENGNFNDDDDGDADLRCTNNCEDNTFDMDISPDKHKVYEAGDTMVDIVDCAADTSERVNQDGDPDATEYSSSFGNTMSGATGADNGLNSNLSEAEVESRFDDVASTLFDGLNEMLRPRKRKLTAHWRKYIRPLMWRCKWIELRVKEFQSQALKYDKELEAYSHRKQYKLGQVGSDNSAARLVPLSCQSDRKQVMKRKKRKRVEDTSDLPSYMSHHSLFSYYEKKKSEADGASIDDECGNQVNAVVQDANTVDEYGVNYEWPVLEPRVSDDSLEQILWNIEVLQSRVFKIKTQINKLESKYARKFSSMDNLSLLMPADQPCGSAQSPAFSPAQGDEMPVGALYIPPGHISEYETGDVVMQESVSSFGEAVSLPDIIESTVGLLSSVDVTHDGPQHGDSCADRAGLTDQKPVSTPMEHNAKLCKKKKKRAQIDDDVLIHNPDDDVLIHNPAAEGELQHLENVNQHMDKPQDLAKEQEEKGHAECSVSAPERYPTSEPESETETEPETEPVFVKKTAMVTEESILKPCLGSEINVPWNKRKRAGRRGRGRGSLGRWNAKKVYTRRGRKDNRRV